MRFNQNLASALAFASPALSLAPLYEDFGPGHMIIPGKFIVKTKDAISSAAAEDIKSLMSTVDYTYNATSFKGFSGSINHTVLAAVDYVEADLKVRPASSYVSQHGAPWGLGRISHRGPQKFTDGTAYVYDDSAGEGVCVYVLDTGILVEHEEFEGRAESLINYSHGCDDDSYGHGTHVAGTIGGKTYGVAKKARLYSVKVWAGSDELPCPDANSRPDEPSGPFKPSPRQWGENSAIMMGMEFVANDRQTRHCPKGNVVNLSLGVIQSRAMNDFARALLNEGVFVAVSTGNDYETARNWSPASESSLCTVGAIDKNNQMADFCNYGPVVDILAPGVDVLSASSENATASMSANGTSMATPHVAGLAACLLASGHKDPKTLCDYMVKTASPLRTVVPSDIVNLVAFNGPTGRFRRC